MEKGFDSEIGICRTILKIPGIWPSIPRDKYYFALLRFTLVFGLIMFFAQIPQAARLIKVRKNFDDLLAVLATYGIPFLVNAIRMLNFWFNREALHELLTSMANDWKATKTQAGRLIMQKYAKISRYLSIFLIWNFESALLAYLVLKSYQWAAESKMFRDGTINASERVRPLYIASDLIYDVQKTPYFEITWICQYLSTLVACSIYVATDAFFSALVLHLCAQMKYLREQFRDLLDKASHQKNKYRPLELVAIVQRHNYLFWFANTIEDVFNLQSLVLFLSSILIFCLTGFQIIMVITSDAMSVLQLIFAIYFYTCFSCSLFMYCFLAMVLSTESTKLGETAYNSKWYDLSPANVRLLIMIMIRTRQPFELTAGKFVAFSLGLYCNVLKTSGGYLSMLLALRSRVSGD